MEANTPEGIRTPYLKLITGNRVAINKVSSRDSNPRPPPAAAARQIFKSNAL